MSHFRTCVASIAIVLVGSAAVAPSASAAESGPPDAATSEFHSGVDEGAAGPSRYVEATSPADASTKLTALETSPQAAAAAGVSFGPCVLNPSVIYLRKSSGYGAVGTKPYTICSTRVTSIHHTTDLRYKWFLWWRLANSTPGSNRGESSYTQRNVSYTCTGTTGTTWAGTTLGTIVYAGRTYYARVYQAAKKVDCKK